ncbi:MAG: M42 family metallopeptidase [Intestinibacillus sp.]
MLDVLKSLCGLPGPSGEEDKVREYIREQAAPYADEILTDAMGNLMVFRKGKKSMDKVVMLAAHMDEVGFIVKRITEDGMLKFGFVGGVDPRVAIGRRVLFGETRGVVGIKAVHLTRAAERRTMPKTDDLYIDIGAASKAAAESKVGLGDYGVFDSGFVEFGDGLIKSRALDDRLGCAVLLTILREQPPVDTWFCFTVQEEVGTRGAATAAYRIKPDLCLVVESTTAADLADVPEHKKVCAVRGGAVVPFMDRGTIYDAALFSLMRDAAEKRGIKWQTKHMVAGGTDAGRIHQSRAGVRVCAVALPTRYIHSPACVGSLEDMESVLTLSRAFLEEIGEQDDV